MSDRSTPRSDQSRASARRKAVIAVLFLASVVLSAGVALRIERTGSSDTINLVWNLFLAWMPLVFALGVYDRSRRGAGRGMTLALGGLWLLFLPNAPYIVTDWIWIDDWRWADVPLWYYLGLYGLAAGTGAILGFISLFLVQRVVARSRGELVGWGLAVASLLLSGVGLYLGRVLRWNSWDIFTRPGALLGDILAGVADPLAYPRALSVTVACAVALVAGYAVFYGVLRTHLEKLDDR